MEQRKPRNNGPRNNGPKKVKETMELEEKKKNLKNVLLLLTV